jgi:hypothetical protein
VTEQRIGWEPYLKDILFRPLGGKQKTTTLI